MAATATAYEFPSTWKSSFSHWWSASKSAGAQAEERLIKRGLGPIPLVTSQNDVQHDKRAILRRYDLANHKNNKNWFLNVLEIGSSQKKEGEHALVIGHGYGNGLAFFWQNYAAMTSVPNTRSYFVDWLGMGRSGRPPFPSIKHLSSDKATEEDMQNRVTQAEDFFISSLEEFRQQEGLKTMTLIGHSIGGYLCSAYALKFPQHVDKLILISPVGVPESPYYQSWHKPPNLKQSQKKEDQAPAGAIAQQVLPASSPAEESEVPAELQQFQPTWWSRLWENNVSPFSILRGSTFLGPSLLSRYAARRFKAFPEEVQSELFDYLYHISTDKGSGEYCLAHLLAPGAYARWPMLKRLGRLDIPITFIYGDNDWMDEKGGRDMVKKIKKKSSTSSPLVELQKQRSKVVVNSHSGHWVFLENPKGFDSIITREIRDAVEDAPRFRGTS